MAALSVTNPTLSGVMSATPLMQNYTDCVTYLNASTLRADGTVAMATALSTNNVDPTLAAHVVRKAYKDGAVVIATTGASQPMTSAATWTTMLFTTKTRDGTNGANASSNYNLGTGVFTTPIAGLYRFEVGVFNASLASDTGVWSSKLITSAGLTFSGPCVQPSQEAGVDPSMSFSVSWYLVAGITVQPQVKSSVGYLPNKTFGNHFMAAWVHG